MTSLLLSRLIRDYEEVYEIIEQMSDMEKILDFLKNRNMDYGLCEYAACNWNENIDKEEIKPYLRTDAYGNENGADKEFIGRIPGCAKNITQLQAAIGQRITVLKQIQYARQGL